MLKLIYSFSHEPWHIDIECKYLNANYHKTNRPLCPKQTDAVSGNQQTLASRQLCCLCTTNNRCLELFPHPPAPAAPATSLQKVLKANSYSEWLMYVSVSFKLFSICLATRGKTLSCGNHLPRNEYHHFNKSGPPLSSLSHHSWSPACAPYSAYSHPRLTWLTCSTG